MKKLELAQMSNIIGGELSPFDCFKAGIGMFIPSTISQMVNISIFYVCWNSEE